MCFVDFVFKASKIHITIILNQTSLKEGFVRDVKNIGKFNNGNIQIFCIENSNVDKIKNSIKQNYNNIVPKHRKYIKQLLTYI